MSDFEIRDTPALAILRQQREQLGHIDPADIAAAQDLLRLAKKLLGAFGKQFALRGLSPGRYALLMALNASRVPLAPSSIAARLGVTRATTTGLIGGLVRDGLVAYVTTDETDGRRKSVALTAKAHELLGAIIPEIFARMADLFNPLSVEERSTLVRLLKRIETGIDHAPVPLTEEERER